MPASLSIVGLSGSLRTASRNSGLLRCARDLAPEGMIVDIADISDIPLYNADVEAVGLPSGVHRLADQLSRADALLLACPEYNYCMAPPLKNALDWLSRIPGNPALDNKPAAIMGAGGGMGTSRAQYQLRQMCVYINVLPLSRPEVFSNAFSASFDEAGNVVDPDLKQQIRGLLEALAIWIERLKP